MKRHIWYHLIYRRYQCKCCGLRRNEWPILGLYRGWPFDNCTGRE